MADFEGIDAMRALAGKLGVTPVTPKNIRGVTRNPLENKVVTRVTPVTPKNNDAELETADAASRDEREIGIAERAAILEFDAGFSREEAERMARAELVGADRR